MRWTSTPESAEAGEITVLAVVETVLAVSVSLWLVVEKEFYTHVLVGGIVAPFLLMRTERSTELGLDASQKSIGWFLNVVDIEPKSFWGKGIPFILIAVVILALPFLVGLAVVIGRLYGCLGSLFENPAGPVSAIPRNWQRYNLCVDSFHPAEAVPGNELERSNSANDSEFVVPRFSEATAFARTSWSDVAKQGILDARALASGLGAILVVSAYVLIFVPAFVYRFSLKATSLIYLPLLWLTASVVAEKRKRWSWSRSKLRNSTAPTQCSR